MARERSSTRSVRFPRVQEYAVAEARRRLFSPFLSLSQPQRRPSSLV